MKYSTLSRVFAQLLEYRPSKTRDGMEHLAVHASRTHPIDCLYFVILDVVCEARAANEEAADRATPWINPILCEQPSAGAQLRRRLRHQEQNGESYNLLSDRHPHQSNVPPVATHLSVDDAMQTHLLSGDSGDQTHLSGWRSQSECPVKGVVEARRTSQKHPLVGPDAVASPVKTHETDVHTPPPFDDEVMTAFCPFGFGGKFDVYC